MLKKYEENNIQNIANKIREKTGSEKTYKVSEMSAGVEEVYVAGRNDILDNSKYIPKTATGTVISLTDVSEVAHKVKVVGVGNKVDVYGKNLIDYTKAFARNSDTSLIVDTATNSIIYNGDYYLKIPIKLPSGQAITLSGEGIVYFVFEYDDGSLGDSQGGSTKTPEKTTRNIYLYKYNPTVSETGYVFRNIQVELGTTATPYEPYTHQTITATPNGTEIDSICPNMNFIADEDIKVDYYSSFGMNEEWSRFWDVYQNKGNRTDYGSAFQSWEDAIFKPKYNIMPVGACGSLFLKSQILDIRKSLKDCGVILDTSRVTGLSYFVHNSTTKSLPKIDMSLCASSSSLQTSFTSATNLEIIEELVSSENTLFHTNTFQNCPKLTHVIFSGVIASDINLQWSPLLDDESLVSLAVALKDFIMNDGSQSFTKTITLSEESWAILDSVNYPGTEVSCKTVIDGKGWKRA